MPHTSQYSSAGVSSNRRGYHGLVGDRRSTSLTDSEQPADRADTLLLEGKRRWYSELSSGSFEYGACTGGARWGDGRADSGIGSLAD